MPKHPVWNYPVDTETLLLLAWFSSLDPGTQLKQLQQEQSWKHSYHLLEEAMQLCLDEVLTGLQGDLLYGPLLVHLVRYRIALVDLLHIASAISIEDMVEPSNALFFSDQPYRSSIGYEVGGSRPEDETEAFCRAMTSHAPLSRHLEQWGQTWGGSVCRGARGLQSFFATYPHVAHSVANAPFFVRELLRMSLAQIDWHRVAARLLAVVPPTCECVTGMHSIDTISQTALLVETLKLAGCSVERLVPGLPNPVRDQALFLVDLCGHTTAAIAHQVDLLCL